jgi:hypothetical protein
MKHIVRFIGPKDDVELEADGISVQAPGLFILAKNNQAVGLFPIGAVAGVWTPDGPAQIQLAEGVVLP